MGARYTGRLRAINTAHILRPFTDRPTTGKVITVKARITVAKLCMDRRYITGRSITDRRSGLASDLALAEVVAGVAMATVRAAAGMDGVKWPASVSERPYT